MLQYRDELAQRLALPSGKSFPDPNNNGNCLKTMGSVGVKTRVARGDKYQLRPRSLRKCSAEDVSVATPHAENTTGSPTNASPNATKSSTSSSKTRQSKPKQKPAPLSKYRRKTANARERSRMREINTAFEALRRAVPHMFVSQCPGAITQAPSEKLTKITTLRLAMRYISALSTALNTTGTATPASSGSQSSSAASTASSSSCSSIATHPDFKLDLDTFFMESSDAESLCTLSDNSFPLSDQPLTPVTFDDNPLGDTAVYFGDHSLSLDFTDQSLSPDFSEHSLSPFDPFLPHFS